MKALLQITELNTGYGRTQVLRSVSLEVGAGEIVAILGANGAGKSTLLNTVMGLLPVWSGEILLDGAPIGCRPTAEIVQSGVIQVPERRQLFGAMTVEENLLMGAYCRRDGKSVRRDISAQFAQFPRLLERRQQKAESLSGGEQQMLALARALMSRPQLLLLDEPTLGLAPLIIRQVMEKIRHLHEAGITVVLVEQNAQAALEIAHRGYVLETGRIALAGAAPNLLKDATVQAAYLGGHSADERPMEGRLREFRNHIAGQR